ncbi:Sigma-adaptin 3A [Kalmusia sp. IMI 367209]|nr:Sigma-adaptin 3A [Kalmusia sp. IMI 367209]
MINAVLVFNNAGQPRLTKFYTQLSPTSSRLILQILHPTTPTTTPLLVTYRHYATLYFIIISTSTESPLALLDLIQVFVQALDGLFENVCELDLIFNFETLHATLAEMIVGGVVVETQLDRVVEGVRSRGRSRRGL